MLARTLSGVASPAVLGRAAGAGVEIGAIQWLKVNPGSGFLAANGQAFSEATYPDLSKKLPLMPGVFDLATMATQNGFAHQTLAQATSGPVTGRIVAAGRQGNLAYTDDPSGATGWTNVTAPWGTLDVYYGALFWGPAGFFACVNSTLYFSPTGSSGWGSVFSDSSSLNVGLYNPVSGLYVVAGASCRVWTSSVGSSSWTIRQSVNNSQGAAINNLCIVNNAGQMIGTGTNGAYYYSSGGTSWVQATTMDGGPSFSQIVVFNGYVWGVGTSNGELRRCSAVSAGSSWSQVKTSAQIWPDGVARGSQSTFLVRVGSYVVASTYNTRDLFVTTDFEKWVPLGKPDDTVGILSLIGTTVMGAGTGGKLLRLPFRSTPTLTPAYADDGTTLLTPYLKAA